MNLLQIFLDGCYITWGLIMVSMFALERREAKRTAKWLVSSNRAVTLKQQYNQTPKNIKVEPYSDKKVCIYNMENLHHPYQKMLQHRITTRLALKKLRKCAYNIWKTSNILRKLERRWKDADHRGKREN